MLARLVLVALLLAATALPAAVALRTRRIRSHARGLLATAAIGAALFVPAEIAFALAERFSGLDAHARAAFDAAPFVYTFLVVAPIEQGLKVAAVWPSWRARTNIVGFWGPNPVGRLDGVV